MENRGLRYMDKYEMIMANRGKGKWKENGYDWMMMLGRWKDMDVASSISINHNKISLNLMT
jgi:hypothetical protein